MFIYIYLYIYICILVYNEHLCGDVLLILRAICFFGWDYVNMKLECLFCFLSGDHHDLIKNTYFQSFADLKWEPKSKKWGATYTCWNHCASKSGAFDHPQHED